MRGDPDRPAESHHDGASRGFEDERGLPPWQQLHEVGLDHLRDLLTVQRVRLVSRERELHERRVGVAGLDLQIAEPQPTLRIELGLMSHDGHVVIELRQPDAAAHRRAQRELVDVRAGGGRRRYRKLDLSFDQTYVGTPTTRGFSHKTALETGFTPSTEYRVDRLGVRGGQHGALAVEGDMYCPSTEPELLSATVDVQKGVIDIATYKTRIKSRKDFALHVKEKAKSPGGKVILRCPALGPSPTVTCPLREMMLSAAKKARPHIEPETLEQEFLDKICTQDSVAFDLSAMQQPAQAFDYGTDEWEKFHQHARNTVESERTSN